MKNQWYHIHPNLLAISLIVIALLLRYWIGKRRFKRRNFAGLQQFKNYPLGLLTSLWEKLVCIFSLLLLIVSIVIYLMA